MWFVLCLVVQSSRFEKSHYKVWRRYRDFEWLRDVTVKTHPTLIVPVRGRSCQSAYTLLYINIVRRNDRFFFWIDVKLRSIMWVRR